MKTVLQKNNRTVGTKNVLPHELKKEITRLIIEHLHVREEQIEVTNAFIENTDHGRIVHYSVMLENKNP